jgi:tetratricopeptide (TPR) repeat protein
MDGRTALRLGVCLLIAAAGCQHQVLNVPGSCPAGSACNPPTPIDLSQVKKAPAKPKNLPPSVLVSKGNFEAVEAFDAKTPLDSRQQLCDLARDDYEKALKIDPKYVPAYQGLARLYTAMHEYPLAVETYQKALKLAPNDAALWSDLGLCHNSQKNWGPALDCLERAVRIEPANRSYTNALGVVLAEVGRYEDSLKCFVRSNGEAMGYYRLGQTLDRLQQTELSRRYLEVAVQKDPSLATRLAMRNSSAVAANPSPPIQQTAYQTASYSPPNVPPAQAAPDPASSSAPTILPAQTSPSAPPSAPPTILPPPPPITGE